MGEGHDLAGLIESAVADAVSAARTLTGYRRPLVGFAAATDRQFARLKTLVDPSHLLPSDILPGARTMVAFFLPFAEEVVAASRRAAFVAEEWARAYEETNKLIDAICRVLTEKLSALGVAAAWEPPTHDFDRRKLVARWSHKSVAHIAGLGEFGRHQMVITPAGCAGRFGSFVMDAALPFPAEKANRLSLPCDEGCRACLDLCPVGALSDGGLDKRRCYAFCLAVDAHYRDRLGGVHDVCGKCATGPCALAV